MFLIKLKFKSKHTKITIPVDFEINPINPSKYAYTADFPGNIQDAKDCSSTIESFQPVGIAGNNQNTILLGMCFDTIQNYHHFAPHKKTIQNKVFLNTSINTILFDKFLEDINNY